MMSKKKPLFAFLCIIIQVACDPLIEHDINFNGTGWNLKHIDNQETLDNTLITLKFDDDKITGSAGCNSYGAKYIIQPKNSFAVNSIENKLEGCIEPIGVMQQEEKYFRILIEVTSYQVVTEELILMDEQGSILLQYERVPEYVVKLDDLVGRIWKLTSATRLDEVNLSAYTIRFENSQLSGTTICREYAGNYQTAVDNLNVTFLRMTTDIDCDKIDGIAESEYTTLLENMEQYNVSPT